MTKIFQIDAFTDEPFKGNPAAVVNLDAKAEESWMQSVAFEMNLSETAFVCKRDGAGDGFNLRWFTPKAEVSLCGHATLASAHILWEQGEPLDEFCFHTLSGELRVWREGEFIWMDFPCDTPERVEAPGGLTKALGLSADPLEIYKGTSDYLIELKSASQLLSLSPDFTALKEIEARGFIVTAGGDGGGFDFVSRFFAPAYGIDEDPVTGSAHTLLAPYWMEKLAKSELTASQISERGGTIHMRVVEPSEAGSDRRVHLGGKAVTIFSGKLY
jgi:PhzF family phenazine biosynthesis protein